MNDLFEHAASTLPAHDAYRGIEHGASLKGLLKPFKGKGELEVLEQVARGIELALAGVMDEVMAQAGRPLYHLLEAQLTKQTASGGTVFLRWRSRGYARMGVSVWAEQMAAPNLPSSVRQELYRYEIARITLNMQMSVVHSLRRQARECAEKMASAERVLRQNHGNHEEKRG